MNAVRLFLSVLVASWSLGSVAADIRHSDSRSKSECKEILERWASDDPKAVPRRLVDACKEKLATSEPLAAPAATTPERAPEQRAAVDPCAGPNAADSVLCWGPWASLAPAAGGEAPATLAAVKEFDPRPELAELFDRTVDNNLPLGSCSPGTPCGFATVVAGVSSSASSDTTTFARFSLAPDGSQFTVDPDGPGEIDSVTGMTARYLPRPDAYENLLSAGTDGDQQSRLAARVVRNEDGSIQLAADVWTHGNRATRAANSGYFAWGIATSQAGLDTLKAGALSVNFAGPMSVDNSTNAAVTINFGAQPNWTGTWTNPGYSFGAGGKVSGVDLISTPAQFTSNVQPGGFVQGVILGERGNQAVAHIIDVTLTDKGHIKDVGLLRELAPDAGGLVIQHP